MLFAFFVICILIFGVLSPEWIDHALDSVVPHRENVVVSDTNEFASIVYRQPNAVAVIFSVDLRSASIQVITASQAE